MREKVQEILVSLFNDIRTEDGDCNASERFHDAEDSLCELFETPVKEFHEKFRHPIRAIPTIPPPEERTLRVKLLLEEVLEFAYASGVRAVAYSVDDYNTVVLKTGEIDVETILGAAPNIVEAADALTDIRYVTDGANLVWGLPQEKLLQEVHSSNMSKLGENGKPIYRGDGKVQKGPNFVEPNIEKILKQAGWEGK